LLTAITVKSLQYGESVIGKRDRRKGRMDKKSYPQVIHKLSTGLSIGKSTGYPQVIHRVIHRLKYRWHSRKTLKSAVQKLHIYYY